MTWSWPDEPILRGAEVALEPVTEENKLEWWNTWTSDVLKVMGVDQDSHDQAGRSIPVSGSSAQLDGFAAVRALDNDGQLCKVVGGVGAVALDDITVELGLWLIPEHRGWGAGEDALRTAVTHWRSQGHEVVVFTGVTNEPMISVAKNIGLEQIGISKRKLPNGQISEFIQFRSPT